MSDPAAVESSRPKQLSHNIELYRDHTNLKASNSRASQEVIILATWINATQKHRAKVIDHYLEHYPDAAILHLTTTIAHFLLPESMKVKALEPAYSYLIAYLNDNPNAQILIHAFSNGGGSRIALLAKTFAERQHHPLPVSAFIFDSLPGTLRLRQDMSTLSQGLPRFWPVRLPLQVLAGAFVAVFYAAPQQVGYKLQPWLLREYLNDERYCLTSAKRLCIYSSKDEVVDAGDVEIHIEEARKAGFDVVSLKFEDSPHVMHFRMHPEEYWAFIKKHLKRDTKL